MRVSSNSREVLGCTFKFCRWAPPGITKLWSHLQSKVLFGGSEDHKNHWWVQVARNTNQEKVLQELMYTTIGDTFFTWGERDTLTLTPYRNILSYSRQIRCRRPSQAAASKDFLRIKNISFQSHQFLIYIYIYVYKLMWLDLRTHQSMFVYPFQSMWCQRPLKVLSVLVEICAASACFSHLL